MLSGDGGVYVIAETANAHEGDPDRLRDLIDAAADTGADAVKVHVYSVDERAVPDTEAYNVNDRLSIPRDAWRTLLPRAKDYGLDVLADVFGVESATLLDEIGISGYKVHAADIGNEFLLEHLAGLGRPISLYVGGVTELEIAEALSILRDNGATDLSLLYGLQNFPTALEDAQLRRVQALKSAFDLPVGYASHVDGGSQFATRLPGWAVAAGADIVETHITLDRERKRTDYHSSLDPDRFAEMVRYCRTVRTAAGEAALDLTDAEREYRADVKKSLVATTEIEPGERITEAKIGYLRVGDSPAGKPVRRDDVLGKRATNHIRKHDLIELTDIDMTVAVVLACRAESTRLYGKPLQLVGEKPILEHVLDRVRQAAMVDEVVVAAADTPSQHSFVDFAERHDLPHVVGSEPDVLQRLIDAGRAVDADVVIRAMTENPFVYWQGLDDAIERHLDRNADLTVVEDLPLGSFVDIHSLRGLEQSHEHGSDRHRSEYTSLYILENSDQFTVETVEPPERLKRPDVRLTIDNPADLILAREIQERLPGGEEPAPLSAVLDMLDQEPSLLEHNDQYPDGTDPDVVDARPFVYGTGSDGDE